MRVVIQRSKNSSVEINNEKVGEIKKGLVLFVGFTNGDDDEIVEKMVNKIINLRIFEDESGLTNLSLSDVQGSVLSISQFTLYADTTSGRRPSFFKALEPREALRLYDVFNEKLNLLKVDVQTGSFGANMTVNITNEGPFTIILDSKDF